MKLAESLETKEFQAETEFKTEPETHNLKPLKLQLNLEHKVLNFKRFNLNVQFYENLNSSISVYR